MVRAQEGLPINRGQLTSFLNASAMVEAPEFLGHECASTLQNKVAILDAKLATGRLPQEAQKAYKDLKAYIPECKKKLKSRARVLADINQRYNKQVHTPQEFDALYEHYQKGQTVRASYGEDKSRRKARADQKGRKASTAYDKNDRDDDSWPTRAESLGLIEQLMLSQAEGFNPAGLFSVCLNWITHHPFKAVAGIAITAIATYVLIQKGVRGKPLFGGDDTKDKKDGNKENK